MDPKQKLAKIKQRGEDIFKMSIDDLESLTGDGEFNEGGSAIIACHYVYNNRKLEPDETDLLEFLRSLCNDTAGLSHYDKELAKEIRLCLRVEDFNTIITEYNHSGDYLGVIQDNPLF